MNQIAIEPPKALLGLLEARAPLEGMGLLASLPCLAFAPRGDGRTIMLAPGYGASDRSMMPLHGYLTWLGYDVHHWGLGRNLGRVEKYVYELLDEVREMSAERGGEKITLIGWSLGGVVMRELAREAPELVREVITMGTPVIGGPKYTRVGAQFAKQQGLDLDAFEQEVHERNLRGIECPITSLYSKSDGVVAWRAAVDNYNAHARNIQVPGSHFGLGINAKVWSIVARTLASEND